jgi:hypothetical protein
VFAVKVAVLEVHEVRVPLDVTLGGEALAAQLAIVLDVGVDRLDVLGEGKVVGETLFTEVALVPVQPQVNRPLVLVESLHPLEALAAEVAVDLGGDGVDPKDVPLEELHPAESLSALGTSEAFGSAEIDGDGLDVIVGVLLVVVVQLLLDLVRVHVHHHLFRTVGIGGVAENKRVKF